MVRKAFTLLEILIVLVVLSVLATVGIPLYQNMVEDSKSRICRSNLQTLKAALDAYVAEKNVVPGDLSSIPPDHIRLARNKVIQSFDAWQYHLAEKISGLDDAVSAYAGFWQELSGRNPKLLQCPAKIGTGSSYGISADLADCSLEAYAALAPDKIIIADCDATTFGSTDDLVGRHRRSVVFSAGTTYANYVTRDGTVASVAAAGGDGGDITNIEDTTEPPPEPTQECLDCIASCPGNCYLNYSTNMYDCTSQGNVVSTHSSQSDCKSSCTNCSQFCGYVCN